MSEHPRDDDLERHPDDPDAPESGGSESDPYPRAQDEADGDDDGR